MKKNCRQNFSGNFVERGKVSRRTSRGNAVVYGDAVNCNRLVAVLTLSCGILIEVWVISLFRHFHLCLSIQHNHFAGRVLFCGHVTSLP